jgi:hypothetical protein
MAYTGLATTFTDEDYPADPYPGARPHGSFAHIDGVGIALRPTPGTPSGWRLATDGTDLDTWLVARGAPPTGRRVPVLAYGSNACPAKVSWLRANLGLTGPAVVLRACCVGLSAVWAAGLRARDDQRPVTLAAAPGVAENHAVWLATADQLRALDMCEGAGVRYHRTVVRTGTVIVQGGWVPRQLLAYVGATPERMPLLVGGAMVRACDVPHRRARTLLGTPADAHGVDTACPLPELTHSGGG